MISDVLGWFDLFYIREAKKSNIECVIVQLDIEL